MGLAAGRTGAIDTTWGIWLDFCASLHQDAYLREDRDPIPLLRLFAHRYRAGVLSPSGAAVRSQTVEGALRAIGQTLATLGRDDPRPLPSGCLDSCLQRQLKAYQKQDPPPSRVKPIPLPIIAQATHL